MNRTQIRSNRQQEKARFESKHGARNPQVCPNCGDSGEYGSHWRSTEGFQKSMLSAEQRKAGGFWVCPPKS